MAKSDNLILKESSGSIGKIMTITKKRSGTMLLGKHRGASSVPATEEQMKIQSRFKQSVIYAKSVMADPDLKKAYAAAAKGDQSAYNVAVRDAFQAPEVTNIDFELYTGLVGSTITVRAMDDFKVASVMVKITNNAGVVIEQGNAVQQVNGLDWLYTATVENDALQGSLVRATAKDLPANVGWLEVAVE